MTSNEPDLQERLSALNNYFDERGYRIRGFTDRSNDLSTREFWWGRGRMGTYEKVLILSYDSIMKHHPLELLDLADSALTEHKPSH